MLSLHKKMPQHTYAIAIISTAVLLRCFLAWNNWPLLNSDEGTMGIMAMHIVHGERPIFFYGQNYMGTGEAYIGALLFPLFGTSVFTLRLGLILLFALFLVCMYVLTCKLYTQKFALFTLIVLSLGSNAVFSRQLVALGGYAETILLTSLTFLLTYQLALSQSSNHVIRRLLLYGSWGVVIGLGLWSDLIIFPWVVGSGILLLLFCWRELLKGGILLVLVGFMIGTFPLIVYNSTATPDQTTWAMLISLRGNVPLTSSIVLQQIKNTMEVSIPTITGSPFCHTDELPFLKILGFEPSYPPTLQCHAVGFTWSTIYLFLLATSAVLALFSLKKLLFISRFSTNTSQTAKYFFQIALFLCSLIALFVYLRSHAPLDGKAQYSRYLICLWVATPLVLWPLWRGAASIRFQWHRKFSIPLIKPFIYASTLLILLSILLYGTGKALAEVPLARAAYTQEAQLIQGLLEHHITRIYTDYWTCDRLAFQSQEHIICGVLTSGCTLERGYHNRYAPYYTIVSNDPSSSYLIQTSENCNQAIHLKMTHEGKKYRTFTLNEYTVAQPT
jgi:hypothetical protein